MKRLSILILFIFLIPNFFNPRLTSAFEILKTAKVDLNGDGNAEEISISAIPDSYGGFVLNVNELSTEGKLSDDINGFAIVDVDTSDEYKEIAVHSPGPSDDDDYLVFWYDGKSIKKMGRLWRWPRFLGNGIVMVKDWIDSFWWKTDKYLLNKEKRTLQLVPQGLYYVGIETSVIKSFPIYRAKGDSTIITNLKPQSKVMVVLYDPPSQYCEGKPPDDECLSDWYVIKSEEGIIGWARFASFWNKLYLPSAD
jgi:hypothetical protein